MKKSKLTLDRYEVWGCVLVLNSLLIFLASLVITLGNSISDGTLLLICAVQLFFGTVLLANGASKTHESLEETST